MPHTSLKRLTEERTRSLFNELDADSNGEITLEELQQAGKENKLGPLYSYESCKSFLQLADTNGSNTLDYGEFQSWVLSRETVLMNLFDRLDVDHRGYVSASQFQHALVDMGCEVSLEHAQKIIDKLDLDKNGTLEYAELLQAALIFPGNTAHEVISKCLLKGQIFMLYEDDGYCSETPAARIMCAGTLSGSLARTLTAPQDRIALSMRAGSAVIQDGRSMLGIAKEMVKHEGMRSLWVGNGVNCIKDGPRSGITFLSYERYKNIMLSDPQQPTLIAKFGCGCMAGLTSMTLTFPLFVAQTRIAVAQKGHYSGLLDCLRKTVAVDGTRGMLRGYDAAALSTGPERGISLMTYMTLRDVVTQDGGNPTVFQSLALGAVSSLIAQVATAPMQTVMVRLMTQGESFGRPVLYNNAADCFRKIIWGLPGEGRRGEGVRALYRGLLPHLLKMIPGSAIQFAAFEYFSEVVQPITG